MDSYKDITYTNDGYGMTVLLSQFNKDPKYLGYAASCQYKYIKKENKYLLRMWLKHKSFDGLFRIEYEGIDTQYISGSRKNIQENICRIISQMMAHKYFDLYIDRFEYDIKCCEKGSEYVSEGVSA